MTLLEKLQNAEGDIKSLFISSGILMSDVGLTSNVKNHFIQSYYHDIAFPAMWYFISKLYHPKENTSLTNKLIRAGVMFATCSAAEFGQKSGLYPGTYDPKDFIAYAAGSAVAVGLDYLISRKKGAEK